MATVSELLAQKAALESQIAEARRAERAEAIAWDDAMASAESGGPLSTAWASDPESQMRNLSRTYYQRLVAELEKVLGLPLTGRASR